MPNETKRVAVIEYLDALLSVFDGQIAGYDATARYSAADYAEYNKPEDRAAYQRAKAGSEMVTFLRTEFTRRMRVLLPGEVDRLFNK